MTLLPTALEEAAKAMHSSQPWSSFWSINDARLLATAAITAYLAQAEKEGWVMVRKPVWTPPFKVGDRVHHISRGESGTVTSIDGDVVRVEFDNRTSDGHVSIGQFDERWFETHNGWLLAAAQNGEALPAPPMGK